MIVKNCQMSYTFDEDGPRRVLQLTGGPNFPSEKLTEVLLEFAKEPDLSEAKVSTDGTSINCQMPERDYDFIFQLTETKSNLMVTASLQTTQGVTKLKHLFLRGDTNTVAIN